MFLKTLSLKGFKSFADATSFDMEPGVTVVVGPNGSGKSNVVDAIGWVLGAQAPSAVRSQKMDDVIFAGTTKRPSLGRAEVGLTIDNSSGLLPIDFSEVTITRTLFRSGDSEYAVNGVPCRLLDIQELLSDSGVGRQQHVIISQGQIDAVLNARPEDRRLIIEEAAGVLKFRRRKERSERRLAATESNLTRIQDLLREVRRQLRPLERQAADARRHGSLVAELTALRTYLAGAELGRLRVRLEHGERNRRELADTERTTRAALASLDTDVLATESQLSAMGGHDLGDDLARSESLRERGRGLASLLAERRRGLERDRSALVDRAVIATLEAEASRLSGELAEVEAEARLLAPEGERLAAAEATLDAARGRFAADSDGFELAAPSGRAAEVRGELGVLRAGVERGREEAARAGSGLEALDDKRARLGTEAERLRAAVAECEAAVAVTVDELATAERSHTDARAALAAADDAHRAADAERHAWSARAEALTLALDEARAGAGAERLADVDGVVGTLLDLVEVEPGWETAFAAAAGEALAAVVVADAGAGRRALEALHAGAVTGAVLPLAAGASPPPAVGAGSLRPRVRATRPGVDELLDRLIGRTVVVDHWAAAVDAALADRTIVVVTRAGDRFGPTGWRVGAGGTGATAAALEEARRRSEEAAGVAVAAEQGAQLARAGLEAVQRVESDLGRALDQHESRMRAAAAALERVDSDRRDADAEADSLRAHLAELQERVTDERARLAELEAVLPVLEAEEQDAAARARALAAARADLDERVAAVAALRRDLEVRGAGIDDRRRFLRRRSVEIEERLARDASEREQAEARRLELERRAVATDRLIEVVDRSVAEVEAAVADLRERRRRQSDAARAVASRLDGLRRERADTERALTEVRERLQRAELDEAEVKLRIETAVEAMRRDLDIEPQVALEAAAPELPEGVSAPVRSRELERELRLMGPINPLALEEHEALQERHEFLLGQLEDIKSSRRELAKVIRAIDGEIVNVFAAAFADVSQNFEKLFETLFPGGRGRLRLTAPDDLLGTGIELEAKPSGKNVKKLSLLSGGERSLTALAYLFAVFRARPSPFYVMDEVEAALDDVNLHRFLDLVHEFRRDAQLIIVSHQKRTMEAADCLYGVTMEPGGSSKVVSEKVTSDL